METPFQKRPYSRFLALVLVLLVLLAGFTTYLNQARESGPGPAVADQDGPPAAAFWLDRNGAPLNSESPTMQALLAALPEGQTPAALTIDSALQAEAERLLADWKKGGAVIVMDPQSGDLLAIAGSSNDGEPGIAEAFHATQPGAAFLPVTLLAGLSQGLQGFNYECTGSTEINGNTWRCWKKEGHGTLDVASSLTASCNCFFYHYGISTGPDALGQVAGALGLGRESGLGLAGEKAGLFPSPERLTKISNHRETWRAGHSANAAIGQGDVQVTPLQLAGVTATLANGGVIYPPRLFREAPLHGPQVTLQDLGISRQDLEMVRQGMRKNVKNVEGSGHKANLPGIELAGRTGSAQTYWKRSADGGPTVNAWFIGFAPYEQPKVAVAVLLFDGGGGGRTAAPRAVELISSVLP